MPAVFEKQRALKMETIHRFPISSFFVLPWQLVLMQHIQTFIHSHSFTWWGSLCFSLYLFYFHDFFSFANYAPGTILQYWIAHVMRYALQSFTVHYIRLLTKLAIRFHWYVTSQYTSHKIIDRFSRCARILVTQYRHSVLVMPF